MARGERSMVRFSDAERAAVEAAAAQSGHDLAQWIRIVAVRHAQGVVDATPGKPEDGGRARLSEWFLGLPEPLRAKLVEFGEALRQRYEVASTPDGGLATPLGTVYNTLVPAGKRSRGAARTKAK